VLHVTRRVATLAVCALGVAAPTHTLAQTRSALADSARRLDSVATALEAAQAPQNRERALRLWREAATLYHAAAERRREVAMRVKIGGVQPDHASAMKALRAALRSARALGDRSVEGQALVAIGRAYLVARMPDSLMAYARWAMQLEQELGDRWQSDRSLPLYLLAHAYHQLGRIDSARAYFQEAGRVAGATGEHRVGRLAMVNLGFIHLGLGRADSALVYYQRALAVALARGDRAGERHSIAAVANVFSQLGLRDSGRVYISQALARARGRGDRADEGELLLALSAYFESNSDHDSTVAYARMAVRLARELGARWRGGASALQAAGHHYWRIGQLDSAEALLREAVRFAHSANPGGVELLFALGDLGNVYAQRSRFDSALVYYDLALQASRAGGQTGIEATWLTTKGIAYADLGRLDSALVYLRRSLTLARESGNRYLQPFTLIGLGSVLWQLDRSDSAAHYYRQAAVMGRDNPTERWIEAAALASLGELHQARGRSDSALVSLHRALAILRESGIRDNAYVVWDALGVVHAAAGRADSALAAYHEGLRLARETESLGGAASLLGHLGDLHFRDGARPDPARAVAYYDSAAAARALVAASTGADQRRVSYAETGTALFERWALAWLARAPEVGERRSALAALAVVERGRAQALLELLRRTHGADSVRARLAEVPNGKAGADMTLEGAALAAAARATGAPVLTFLSTPDTLVSWLLLPSGEVAVTRRPIGPDPAARLVATVRADLGVDEGGGRALRTLAAADDLRAALAGVRSGTQSEPRTVAPAHGETSLRLGQLADLSLPPELRRRLPPSGPLVVIAGGSLALVPFAALPAGTAGAADGDPLGVRYALRYAPSLATLAAVEGAAPARRPTAGRALVVGNPGMPSVRSRTGRVVRLPALPGAEREGRWVASALGAPPLTGRAATERAVHARIAEAPVVHLATHGFAFSSDARALDSFVALAPDESGDGMFTVGEILDATPRLSADLVVLSACQTGLGNLKQAEGTVGLQRAFLAKGARSVLVSLWSVSDEATELLMRRFYTHWLRGADKPNKAEALRRAQADVRAVPRFRAPRYWAAFQLVGAP
jgi:tetratricopeptide (TPR) repeat protein